MHSARINQPPLKSFAVSLSCTKHNRFLSGRFKLNCDCRILRHSVSFINASAANICQHVARALKAACCAARVRHAAQYLNHLRPLHAAKPKPARYPTRYPAKQPTQPPAQPPARSKAQPQKRCLLPKSHPSNLQAQHKTVCPQTA